jgi:3-oxoacyl-[acyl-carrier protein] reductase
MKDSTPVGRFANADETASAVVFLAAPQAAYINGINLPVDGGRTQSL